MTVTNHDDQLGEIYPMMLNELNCTFGVGFSRFHCCGRHDHGLWPSWYRPTCRTATAYDLSPLGRPGRVLTAAVLQQSNEVLSHHLIKVSKYNHRILLGMQHGRFTAGA